MKQKGYNIKENLSEKDLLRLIVLQNKAILTQLALVEGSTTTAIIRNTYWDLHLEDIERYTDKPTEKPWTIERAEEEIGSSKLSILCNMKKRLDEGMDKDEFREKMKEFNVWEYKGVIDTDWIANYND